MTDGCKLLFIATSTGTLSVLPVKYNPAVVGHCIKIYLDTEFFFFGGGGEGGCIIASLHMNLRDICSYH